MIRKNLSITDYQNRAIEQEAKRTGKIQGEVIRGVLDSGLNSIGNNGTFSPNDLRDIQKHFSWAECLKQAGNGSLTGRNREIVREGRNQMRASGFHCQGNLQIPYEILNQRDLTVGTDNQGGYTVATELWGASFIELLHNAMKVRTMGATFLDNLVGDVAIPSQATGATVAWEGENDANAETSPTFGQVSLTPNRVGCYTEISKKLLVQSVLSVDHLVKNDLATSIALGIDLAALHGSGSGNQPTGIASTSGIGSVAGGTNGLAPAWDHVVELETDVADSNGILNSGTIGYLTNNKVRGKLKQIFTNSTYGEIPVWNNDILNGYKAEVSNQVSSTLTKGTSNGVCSAIFFGDWSQLIVAMWGGLDMVVDPYSLATTNMTRITANIHADVGVRHAASFSVMLDALTA